MSDNGKVPVAGQALTIDDLEMVLEAIGQRRNNFPEEPLEITFAAVFLNIGDRFAPVFCTGEEWSGLKTDISPGEGLPLCPNGHPLIQGKGLRLGWVQEV